MASTLERAVAPGQATRAPRPGVSTTDLLLLGMALIWGVNFSVVKFGTEQLAPLAFNGARVALAATALLAISAGLRRAWPSSRDVLMLLLLGVLGNGIYQVLFIQGVARTRAGDAALMLSAAPAFIALLGRINGVERISRRGVVGIGLSILGMALVVLGSADRGGVSTLAGNLFLLAGCLCWSVFTVLLKPYTHRVDGIQLSALTMTGGALPLLAVSAPSLAGTAWSSVSAGTWAAIAYSGLLALVVAYILWYRGVRVIGPTRTAMYGNLQPIIALAVAWGMLGEVPTPWQALGVFAITSGLILTRS